MMKIVFFVHGLGVGGAEKFLVSLVNNVDSDLFDITLVSFSKENPLKDELNSNVKFISVYRNSKIDFNFLLKLRKLILRLRPETMFFVGLFSFFLVNFATLLLKFKVRRIVSYHTTIPRNRKENLLTRLYLKALNKKDHIITVSKNQANYTIETFEVPESYFTTIHNGINVEHWVECDSNFDKAEFRAKYDISPSSKVIILTAAFRKEKNHEAAVHALKIVHENYDQDVCLLFVGGGETQIGIRKLVEELDLVNYVKFVGLQDDVRPFYWISDLFTLCSDSVETFSIAALEAMSSGLPCVLTDIGGASEMIVRHENGLLCQPDSRSISDAWINVLRSNGYSSRKISQFVADNFSQKEMVLKYQKFLSSK